MINAGVFVDDYKLPAFYEALDGGGFKYEKRPGPISGVSILVVSLDIKDKEKLTKLVKDTNAECSRGVN